MYYVNNRANWGKKDGTFSMGLNMSNLGAKMSYTRRPSATSSRATSESALHTKPKSTNTTDVTVALDANKLLVPTRRIYALDDPSVIVSGMDPNVGVANGIIQSFYDAPGIVTFDSDGEATVVEGAGSRRN